MYHLLWAVYERSYTISVLQCVNSLKSCFDSRGSRLLHFLFNALVPTETSR